MYEEKEDAKAADGVHFPSSGTHGGSENLYPALTVLLDLPIIRLPILGLFNGCCCLIIEYAKMLGQWRSIAREVLDHTAIIAKFLCLLHITDTHIITTTQVYGPSMLPTLNLTGDVLLTERISVRIGKVGVGDVVLVRSPENPKRIVTKRMEGDRVTFVVDPRRSDRSRTIVVPKGHLWIQGDNTYSSRDSRQVGPIPYDLIQGKVFCRVWPPRDFGFLDG